MKNQSPIRKLAQPRTKSAINCLSVSIIWAFAPVAFYLIFGVTQLLLYICVICCIGTVFFVKQGQKLWQKAQQANQVAYEEDGVTMIIKPLHIEGWSIEYNHLTYLG